MIPSLTIFVFLFGFFLTAQAVNLKDAFGGQLSTVGARSGFNTKQTTVEPIISTVISVILSFLGVIFLILMVYGGYTWMMAAGNEEKVKKAKLLIQAAVLGLLIVVGAYAITVFIMGRLAKDLIPGSDNSSVPSSSYTATSATGCCVVRLTTQGVDCHGNISEDTCKGTFAGASFYSSPCSEVPDCSKSSSSGTGCCIETIPPKPPFSTPTYVCTEKNQGLCPFGAEYIDGKKCVDPECQR